MLFAGDYWVNAGKVYRGVEVGDVALGGKTPAQAEDLIREQATGAVKEVRFGGGPEEVRFTADEMGVDYNVEATVDQAYAVGREGNILGRISDRVKAAYGTIEVSPNVDYESAKARTKVEEISSRLDAAPREADVEVVGSAVEATDSREGYETDVPATLASVNSAVEDMSGEATISGRTLEPEHTTAEAQRAAARAREAMGGELLISGVGEQWNISPAAVGDSLDIGREDGSFQVGLDRDAMRRSLDSVYSDITREPVEADYNVDGTDVSVSPGREGRSIQDEKFLDAIQAGIFQGKREYAVPVVIDKPEMTTAEAEAMKPTDMLGEFSTNYMTYDDAPGRVTNLKTGAGSVDGQLVAPGETFSFNDLASQYDYENASVIVEGKVDESEGGGLCQVSSTLYMAANYAGLDITERHPHYAELPYIQPGFDATVWFGALDMQFENTTDGYILIKENVNTDTGEVYSAVYGAPQNVDVEMSSKKTAEYQDDKGNPITEWVTHQTVTRDGKVEFDGVYHKDTYEYLQSG